MISLQWSMKLIESLKSFKPIIFLLRGGSFFWNLAEGNIVMHREMPKSTQLYVTIPKGHVNSFTTSNQTNFRLLFHKVDFCTSWLLWMSRKVDNLPFLHPNGSNHAFLCLLYKLSFSGGLVVNRWWLGTERSWVQILLPQKFSNRTCHWEIYLVSARRTWKKSGWLNK